MNLAFDSADYFGGFEIIKCIWPAEMVLPRSNILSGRSAFLIPHPNADAGLHTTPCAGIWGSKQLRTCVPTSSGFSFHTRPAGILIRVRLAAHLSEFLGWITANVRLLLPSRQSRGDFRLIRSQRGCADRGYVRAGSATLPDTTSPR
jgi:hypothetical protein